LKKVSNESCSTTSKTPKPQNPKTPCTRKIYEELLFIIKIIRLYINLN
jgi:hypothetical protein